MRTITSFFEYTERESNDDNKLYGKNSATDRFSVTRVSILLTSVVCREMTVVENKLFLIIKFFETC